MKKVESGFSLFEWKKGEVIVVVAIVLVVGAVSAVQLVIGAAKTRDAQRKADVELVARALRVYFEEYGFYPASEEGKVVACGREGAQVCEWGQGKVTDGDGVVYLARVPADPLSGKGYRYWYEVGAEKDEFKIYTALEYGRDPGRRQGLTRLCGQQVQCKWYVGD